MSSLGCRGIGFASLARVRHRAQALGSTVMSWAVMTCNDSLIALILLHLSRYSYI